MVTALRPLTMTGQQVRDICLPGMRAGDRKNRLIADWAIINDEEAALRRAIQDGNHRAFTSTVVPSATVRADMSWFYEHRLRDSGPGRKLWDLILGLGGRRCPLCHLAKPRTLDHSYPQAKFPRLALEPMNLVPACIECNTVRNVGHGTITVSPYFDDWVVNQPWLCADVMDLDHPEDLRFHVVRHSSFSDEEWAALQQFVSDIDLLDRCVSEAVDAFASFKEELRILSPSPSAADAQTMLETKVMSHLRSFGINRWETVAFEAWRWKALDVDWSAVLASSRI